VISIASLDVYGVIRVVEVIEIIEVSVRVI
jgi:hypothetical protein